jgi:chromosome segregation ATPase
MSPKRVRHAETHEVRFLDPNSKKEYIQLRSELGIIQDKMYNVKKIIKLMKKLDVEFPKKKQKVRQTLITQLTKGTGGLTQSDLQTQSDDELIQSVLDECNRIYPRIHQVSDEIYLLEQQIRALQREYKSPFGEKIAPLEASKRQLAKDKEEMSQQLTQYGELVNDLEESYETLAEEIQHHSQKMMTPPSPNLTPPSPTTVGNTSKNASQRISFKHERRDLLREMRKNKEITGGKTRRCRRRHHRHSSRSHK